MNRRKLIFGVLSIFAVSAYCGYFEIGLSGRFNANFKSPPKIQSGIFGPSFSGEGAEFDSGSDTLSITLTPCSIDSLDSIVLDLNSGLLNLHDSARCNVTSNVSIQVLSSELFTPSGIRIVASGFALGQEVWIRLKLYQIDWASDFEDYDFQISSNISTSWKEMLPLQIGNLWQYRLQGHNGTADPYDYIMRLSVIDSLLTGSTTDYLIQRDTYLNNQWSSGQEIISVDSSGNYSGASFLVSNLGESLFSWGFRFIGEHLPYGSYAYSEAWIMNGGMIFTNLFGVGKVTYSIYQADYYSESESLVGWRINGQSSGDYIPVAIDEKTRIVPLEYLTVYPNPSNGDIKIKIQSQFSQGAALSLISLTGKEIMSINLNSAKGSQFELNLKDLAPDPLPSGIYFLRIKSGIEVRTAKFTLLN